MTRDAHADPGPRPTSLEPTLRELLEEKIRRVEQTLHQRLNLEGKQRKTQATEYERRLTELNHAHAQAVAEKERTMPRESFQAFHEDFVRWRDKVNEAILSTAETKAAVVELRVSMGVINSMANKIQGAMILIGLMGMAGVLALVLGLARLAGVLQ